MESVISILFSAFTSYFLPVILIFFFGIALIIWWTMTFLNKRKIHNRLLEIAFERGIIKEKSRII